MTGLPRKYAKMGFKKGWRAYKQTKKSTRSVKVMARRRKGGFRRYIKKRYSAARKGFNVSSIMNMAIGVGIVVLYEVFVSPLIPLSTMTKNIVELGVGLVVMSMPRMPTYVRSAAMALSVVNLYQLLVPLAAGINNNNTGGAYL